MADLKKITSEYKYRTELHAHTSPVSSCSFIAPEMLVDAYLDAKADGVVITNHLNPHFIHKTPENQAEVYAADYYAAKKAAEGKPLNVIFGVEICFTENPNDYVVYGVTPDELEEMLSLIPYGIENFYKKFKKPTNVILQAHPFRSKMVLAPPDSLDGIEVFNMHPHHNSQVALAAKYAKEHNMIISGGSDYHDPDWHALCLTCTKTPLRDSYDVAEAILSKDIIFDICGNIVLPYNNI